MKTSIVTKFCVGTALILLTSSFANAQRTYPTAITGSFAGIQSTATGQTQAQQVPTLLNISRGGNNLRLVSVQLINGQNVTMQTVLRANGTADVYTSVDGVIVQSGTGRFSRRGRVLNANFAIDNSNVGPFALNQQFTVRGKRVSFLQSSPQTGTTSFLIANQ